MYSPQQELLLWRHIRIKASQTNSNLSNLTFSSAACFGLKQRVIHVIGPLGGESTSDKRISLTNTSNV